MLAHYAPYKSSLISVAQNLYQPSTEESFNNTAFILWERALFQRAASSIEFTLPEDWSGSTKDFFLYVLFATGYAVVYKELKYGLIFQPCTLDGYNIYYQPARATVTNPALDSRTLEIGKDCQLLKLTPDYLGIWDIISCYAEKLALLESSLNMTFVNSKVAYILAAKNKSAARALKAISDKVNAGQTTVVYDKAIENEAGGEEPWSFIDRKGIKDSYIGTELLDNMRTIINNFDSEIGIPVLPAEKKERMITDEAKGRQADGKARQKVWLETFNSSAKLVNEKFGTSIRARSAYEDEEQEEGEENNVNENNPDRDV